MDRLLSFRLLLSGYSGCCFLDPFPIFRDALLREIGGLCAFGGGGWEVGYCVYVGPGGRGGVEMGPKRGGKVVRRA